MGTEGFWTRQALPSLLLRRSLTLVRIEVDRSSFTVTVAKPLPLSPSSLAYVLVAHGSRDPRSQAALDGLLAAVRALVPVPSSSEMAPPVRAATLEFAPRPLPEAIAAIARTTGVRCLRVVPLFLQAGAHACEDVPAAVDAARELLGGAVAIEILPPIGSAPPLAGLLAARFEGLERLQGRGSGGDATPARRLLVAHGSRRDGGNDPVAKLAARLDATLAFWAIAPDLETQVAAIAAKTGTAAIAIAPYFLFPGSITDAIAARVLQLQAANPNISIALAPPLSATPDLAQLIVNLCRS